MDILNGNQELIGNISTSGKIITSMISQKGDKGEKGETGDSATITIGTITTIEAGMEASVINTGTKTEAILNFKIPKGADGTVNFEELTEAQKESLKGEKGDVGERGETGANGKAATITIGTITSGEEAKVTNSGTETDAVFDFVIPQGPSEAQDINYSNSISGLTAKDVQDAIDELNKTMNAVQDNIKITIEALYPVRKRIYEFI